MSKSLENVAKSNRNSFNINLTPKRQWRHFNSQATLAFETHPEYNKRLTLAQKIEKTKMRIQEKYKAKKRGKTPIPLAMANGQHPND